MGWYTCFCLTWYFPVDAYNDFMTTLCVHSEGFMTVGHQELYKRTWTGIQWDIKLRGFWFMVMGI